MYKRMAGGGQDWTSPDVLCGAGVLIGKVAAASLHSAVVGIELRNFMVKPVNRGNRTPETLASPKNDRNRRFSAGALSLRRAICKSRYHARASFADKSVSFRTAARSRPVQTVA
jgi:hypothetical protein